MFASLALSDTVFCQEQRPLLPRGLRNAEREQTLGRMWKSLPDEEKAKYKAEDGTVRKPARCNVELIPFQSPAPAPGAPSVVVPLTARVAAGVPPAMLPAAPSAAPLTLSAASTHAPTPWSTPSAPTQSQLTQTLGRMAEDDAVDLLEEVLINLTDFEDVPMKGEDGSL